MAQPSCVLTAPRQMAQPKDKRQLISAIDMVELAYSRMVCMGFIGLMVHPITDEIMAKAKLQYDIILSRFRDLGSKSFEFKLHDSLKIVFMTHTIYPTRFIKLCRPDESFILIALLEKTVLVSNGLEHLRYGEARREIEKLFAIRYS